MGKLLSVLHGQTVPQSNVPSLVGLKLNKCLSDNQFQSLLTNEYTCNFMPVANFNHQFLSEKDCSAFSSFNQDQPDFTTTFIADKLVVTSPTLGTSHGTVDRGNLGSSSYSGKVTFVHNNGEFVYMFYLETRSFHWTKVSDGSKSTWLDGVSVTCPFVFPSKYNINTFPFSV